MTSNERYTIIETTATTGNIIEATIAQNLLDTYYDDRFVWDYLYYLTTREQLSPQDMAEVLGRDAHIFYKKHQDLIDNGTTTKINWQANLGRVLQNEITRILNMIDTA